MSRQYEGSIISSLSKDKYNPYDDKKNGPNTYQLGNNNKSLSSFISQSTFTVTSQKQQIMLQKLSQLQNTLINKINDLKSQKISLLEQYNRQFDKFTDLSLQVNKLSNQEKYQQSTSNNNDKDISKEQQQLKRKLYQLYEITEENRLQESKLNISQLDDLSNLINLHSLNFRKFQENLTPQLQNSQINQYRQFSHSHIHLNKGITQTEEIFILKQAIENYLPKRLKYLQSEQLKLRNFQNASKNNVSNLQKRKSLIEKQMLSLDQLLKQYENRYQMYKSQQQILGTQTIEPQWIKKYKKMAEFKTLKSQYKEIVLIVNKNNVKDSNIRHGLNKIEFNDQILINDEKQNDFGNFQFRQQERENIQGDLIKLEQQVKKYEQFLQSQNKEKILLFNEIKQKQEELSKIKSQNQTMTYLLTFIM